MSDSSQRPADEIHAAYVEGVPSTGRIVLTEYDAVWPHFFERGSRPHPSHARRCRLARRARRLAFRDRLRANDDDRELYAQKKRDLASREWAYVQHYADAKGAIVEEILARHGL